MQDFFSVYEVRTALFGTSEFLHGLDLVDEVPFKAKGAETVAAFVEADQFVVGHFVEADQALVLEKRFGRVEKGHDDAPVAGR